MGGSSPDNDGMSQNCQMAHARQARRKGVTRREPVVEPPQAARRLEPGGYGPDSSARLDNRRLRSRLFFVGKEATGKVCGVPVARLQGNSWAPTPSIGCVVNVGTVAVPPHLLTGQVSGGQDRRRLMVRRQDGAPVVVRDRESRLHGEGGQRVRSVGIGTPGDRR